MYVEVVFGLVVHIDLKVRNVLFSFPNNDEVVSREDFKLLTFFLFIVLQI